MDTIVVYKSKYGATMQYAKWIAEALNCEIADAKDIKCDELLKYDTIIYGGGLYAEVIGGVHLITKNFEALKDKNLIVYSVGITPLEYREYYDELVLKKNFRPEMIDKIKVYNFVGKMILDELTLVHRTAIKSLKKLMQNKKEPTEMEKLLISLCDFDGDGCDRESISDMISYVKELG